MNISTLKLGHCKVLLQFRIKPRQLPPNIQVRKAGPCTSEEGKTPPIMDRNHSTVDLKALLTLGYSVDSVYAVKRDVKRDDGKVQSRAYVYLWLKRESPATGFRHWEGVQDFISFLAGATWNFIRVYRNENGSGTPLVSINLVGKLESYPPLASLSFKDIEAPAAAHAPRQEHAAASA